MGRRDVDQVAGIRESGERNKNEDGTVSKSRGRYLTSGIHHIPIVCRSLDETVKFYEEALGMKMRALFPMHGVPGAKHCFLEAGNGCELSFIEFKTPINPIFGVSLPKSAGHPCGVGSLQHLAFKADSLEQLKNLRAQIEKTGTLVSPILSHGFCLSFYFSDPNGVQLEVCFTLKEYSEEELQLNLVNQPVTTEKTLRVDEMVKEAAIEIAKLQHHSKL